MTVLSPRLEEITECYLAVPRGHRHLRLALRYGDQVLILPEAVVAAIARGYVDILTHPQRRAVAFRLLKLDERKEGFAEFQLLESPEEEATIAAHLARLLEQAERP
jgi:hypothetical protein